MYQFLCIFGPGVLAWLAGRIYGRRFRKEAEEKTDLFLAAAQMISYALAAAAVTAAVCRPSGRMQFVTLADGTLTVHYGASALAVAVAAAAGIGVCGAAIEIWCEKRQK